MRSLKPLILILFLSLPTLALSEQILECMQPVNLDDPNFVQGSEVFFDLFLDDEKGLTVNLTRGSLEREVFLPQGSESKVQVHIEEGLFYAEWEKPSKISLVIRDFGDRWRGEFWFSEGYKTSRVEIWPGRDLDLACIPKGRLKL